MNGFAGVFPATSIAFESPEFVSISQATLLIFFSAATWAGIISPDAIGAVANRANTSANAAVERFVCHQGIVIQTLVLKRFSFQCCSLAPLTELVAEAVPVSQYFHGVSDACRIQFAEFGALPRRREILLRRDGVRQPKKSLMGPRPKEGYYLRRRIE
jgi:hypothetical protein